MACGGKVRHLTPELCLECQRCVRMITIRRQSAFSCSAMPVVDPMFSCTPSRSLLPRTGCRRGVESREPWPSWSGSPAETGEHDKLRRTTSPDRGRRRMCHGSERAYGASRQAAEYRCASSRQRRLTGSATLGTALPSRMEVDESVPTRTRRVTGHRFALDQTGHASSPTWKT